MKLTYWPFAVTAALALTVAMTGCTTSAPPHANPSPLVAPSQATTPGASPTPAGPDPKDPTTWLVSATGIGPLQFGMTSAELKAANVPDLEISTTNSCLNAFQTHGDSQTDAGGTFKNPLTLGFAETMSLDGPHTAKGIRDGSTLLEALTAYPTAVFVPKTADGLEGVRVSTGGTWIVFESLGGKGKSDKIDGMIVGLKAGHPQGECP
jgi:hypothetical protein